MISTTGRWKSALITDTILVTTAEIRVIGPNLSRNDFSSESEINDVAELKGAIILNEKPGPQRHPDGKTISKNFKDRGSFSITGLITIFQMSLLTCFR
jgi:hypothetical protein